MLHLYLEVGMVPGGWFGPDRFSQRSGRRNGVSGADFGPPVPGRGVAAPPEQRRSHIYGDNGEEEGGKEHDRVQIHDGAQVRSGSAREAQETECADGARAHRVQER